MEPKVDGERAGLLGRGRARVGGAVGETAVVGLALLALVGAVVMLPLGPWLMLSAWFGALARKPLEKLAARLGGRPRAASLMTVALFLVLTAPLVLMTVSLTKEAIELGHRMLASNDGKNALLALVSPNGPGESPSLGPKQILDLVQKHGDQARSLISGIAGAATNLVVGTFIFFWGAYTLLVHGPGARAWFADRLPVPRAYFDRMVAAFVETGRGLLIGTGLTGLAQAVVATVTYIALGVPRAMVLGLMTLAASVIPSVGCALVWVPVAAALAIAGEHTKAIILVAVGTLVVGSVDNVLRPVFSRYGKLELPSFVVMVAIFGGLALFGGWGILIGPLLVRLGREALDIARDDGLLGPDGERRPLLIRPDEPASKAALAADAANADPAGAADAVDERAPLLGRPSYKSPA